MIKTVFFLKIKFSNNSLKDFKNIIKKRGLFLFPSGPGLSTLEDDKQYYESLKKADINFFDSGYFVLLLKLLKNINVNKCSGYLFIKYFLEYLKYSKTNIKIMSVDPSKNLSISIKRFLLKDYLKKKKLINYVAPFYNNHNITDPTLLKIIKKKKTKIYNNQYRWGYSGITWSLFEKKFKLQTDNNMYGWCIDVFNWRPSSNFCKLR